MFFYNKYFKPISVSHSQNKLLTNNKQCTNTCSEEFLSWTVTFYSYSSNLLKSFNINSTENLIDLSYLPKGSYSFKACIE